MSDSISIFAARAKLYCELHDVAAYIRYIRQHGIDQKVLSGFAGACVVRNVIDCGNDRFEFANGKEDQLPAFVCEAFGTDGETVIDLVAWPLDRPVHVMTMFGRCGLLGAWEAMNPATYYLDNLLAMYRTPLEWLQADCSGAVVVTPHIAARMLIDLPGKIAVRDYIQSRQIEALRRSILPSDQVRIPISGKGRAA